MKFPSFIKTPRNKRFQFEPRYYDPVKEEIEERVARIKREVDGDDKGSDYKPGNISFEKRSASTPDTSFLTLLIAAILGITIVGWLYFGNQIFYALWAVVPFYLYFRFRKTTRKK